MDLDSLSVLAEIGAALAGFATLAGVFRQDPESRIPALGVVENGLIAVAFSLLPRIIGDLRVCALLFLIAWCAGAVHSMMLNKRITGGVGGVATYSVNSAIGFIFLAGGIASSVMVVFGGWPEHQGWLYQSAVICPILMSCMLLRHIVSRLILSEDASEDA